MVYEGNLVKKVGSREAEHEGEQTIWVAVLLHGDADGINAGELVSAFADNEEHARNQMRKFFQDDEETGDFTLLAAIKPMDEIIQFAVVGDQSAVWLPLEKRNRIH